MKTIGLTGGIGTGKSTVAAILVERGWTVLSSDATAHTVMTSDSDARAAIVALLGNVYLEDGSLNRAAIAESIFGDSDGHHHRKRELERIVHPRVLDMHMHELERLRAAGTAICCIESALLYEVGLEEAFDYVVVVDADDEVRIQRVIHRSALSRADVEARIAEQMPMSEKRAAADFLITNNTNIDDLRKATNLVAMIVEALPNPDTTEASETS
jgi:dephospho-CoA kinase